VALLATVVALSTVMLLSAVVVTVVAAVLGGGGSKGFICLALLPLALALVPGCTP